jgi:predicted nucleic-acid-binding protein
LGRKAVTIIADTNLLVRIFADDDRRQRDLALAEFENAERIVVTISVLCELSWVLTSRYRLAGAEIASAIRALFDRPKIVAERSAILAGLAMLDAGGDFADGVIAQEGRRLGGETFVSFDRKAVRLLVAQGNAARLPTGT